MVASFVVEAVERATVSPGVEVEKPANLVLLNCVRSLSFVLYPNPQNKELLLHTSSHKVGSALVPLQFAIVEVVLLSVRRPVSYAVMLYPLVTFVVTVSTVEVVAVKLFAGFKFKLAEMESMVNESAVFKIPRSRVPKVGASFTPLVCAFSVEIVFLNHLEPITLSPVAAMLCSEVI